MTSGSKEQPPMVFGGPTPHTDMHPRHIVYMPFDVATDLLSAAGHVVLTGLQGAGHIAAEGVRDITGDQTALGGHPEQQEHPRNVLWIPYDTVKGALIASGTIVHHSVAGVGTATADTVKDAIGTE